MSVPQWNADIITPASEAGGTQVIGDNQEVQTTLESGDNITIEDGKISATGDLDQVQSDWTESDTTDPSYIQNKPDLSIYAQSANLATVATSGSYADLSNKPTIPTATSDLTNDSGFITASDIPAQAQADWTESDSSDPSYIQNKPTLAAVATSGDYADLSNKPSIPSAQVNSDWAAESGVAAILNKPSLATVATSGSYADLSNKPTIPEAQVNSDWNASTGVAAILNKPDLSIYAQSANLATVATSGDYADLSNKPTIPTATSDLTNDSGFITLSDVPAQQQADWTESDTSDPSYIAHKPNLATVATSGSYSDLSGTPTIPTVDQSYSASSTNAMSGVAVAQAVAGAGGLPASTSADENKVLTVDDQGDAGWEMPAVTSTSDWTPDPTPYSISGYDPANDYAKGLSGNVFEYDDFSRPSEVLYYEGIYDEKYDTYDYWDLESSTVSDMGGNPDGRYLSLIAWDPYDSSRYFIYNDAQFAQVESYDRSGVTTYKVKDIVNKVITITTGWVDANGDSAIPNLSYGELVLSFFDPTAVPSFSSYYLPNGKLGVQIPTSIIGTILLLKQDTAVLEHLVNRINGKELFAKRALFDIEGNPIVYTYLKQENYRPIPDPGFANAGDVLTAVDDMYSGRTIAWQAPQGGGSSSSVSVGMAYPPVNYPSYTSAETNPLNLSANTIRCKFTAGFDPSQVSTYFTWTLVDSMYNIWDGYNADTDWVYELSDEEVPLFNEAAIYLREVLGANTSGITSIKRLFENCSNLESVALFDTSSCTDLRNMFSGCNAMDFTSIPAFDTSSCTNFDCFCSNCQNLTSIPLIDTSKATTFAYAFGGCSALTSIPMLDTSNCSYFPTMFENCSSIEEVPLFDTSKGYGFSGMFAGCTSLKHIPLFSTESADDVGNMFDGCTHVEYGALALYQQMTSQAHVPSGHGDTFRDCGSLTTNGAAELAQIDSSWGGTQV